MTTHGNNRLTSHVQSFLRSILYLRWWRYSVPTIVPSGILSRSQGPYAVPYLDPVKSHLDPHIPSPPLLRCFNFVCLVLATEVLYAFLVLPARAASSARAFFLHFTCIASNCLRRSFIIRSLLKTLNLIRNISLLLHFLKSLSHCFLM
jgi:hypothetical protein